VLAGAEASDGEQQRHAWPAGIQKSMGAAEACLASEVGTSDKSQ
jgi:hypothetical protein